jgi:hypothetical protein
VEGKGDSLMIFIRISFSWKYTHTKEEGYLNDTVSGNGIAEMNPSQGRVQKRTLQLVVLF